VASLRKEGVLRSGPVPSARGVAAGPVSQGGTQHLGHDELDLGTAMEAAAALSMELQQDRLLARLLTLSMRHAGAQRAFFLVEEDGRTRAACALGVTGEIEVDPGKPIEQRADLAISVVRYVERTGETVAVSDAGRDPRFERDAYVQRTGARSILCLPVMRQGMRKGILYLENTETAAAFTPAHIRLLSLLSAQAAISIENAALYDTLEQKVQQRTAELAEKNAELLQKNAEILKAQAHLVQSEKMASLGQLVAGVAHEINNPINFIASGLPSLRRDVDKVASMVPAAARGADFDKIRGRLGKLFTAIEDGTKRTAEIVKNLRSFSRLDEAAQKTADLHEALDSTLSLLTGKLGDRITVERRYGDLPKVECYPSQLNQVFMNLFVNAVQAMDDRGTLTIETARDGETVTIAVSDTGKGIPPEIRDKIFDPFFTTKPVGEGTGLGLSISHGIIAKHGGHIEVESEPGRGTKFKITLPVSGAAAGKG
jgi:signal transduction histidine kinase